MTHSGFPSVAQYVVALAFIALAGCSPDSGPMGEAPAVDTVGQSAEYPVSAAPGDQPAAPTTTGLKVMVSLSQQVAKKAASSDVVFVFARAAQGPRMPLALARMQVKDLPATVILDDSNGMSPDMKLSSVPEVVVVARVSKSGMAGPQPGDLEGVSGPVKPGQSLSLSIANVVTGQ